MTSGRTPQDRALVVVDVQQGFADHSWGTRNNPDVEANIERLIAAWRRAGQPVVYVRHDSDSPGSPLRPGQLGNDLQPLIHGRPDLLVAKSANSAFHGSPDLHAWLAGRPSAWSATSTTRPGSPG